jgi:hypothetical protein
MSTTCHCHGSVQVVMTINNVNRKKSYLKHEQVSGGDSAIEGGFESVLRDPFLFNVSQFTMVTALAVQ